MILSTILHTQMACKQFYPFLKMVQFPPKCLPVLYRQCLQFHSPTANSTSIISKSSINIHFLSNIVYSLQPGYLYEPAHVVGVHLELHGPLGQLGPLGGALAVDGQTELCVLVLALF